MSTRSRQLLLAMILSAAMAWAADPVLGTWQLDLAKSKFRPGPAPKSQTRIYEAQGAGIRVTVKTLEADGHSTTVHISANYDGKDYPVTGGGEIDAIALKKVDERTAEATLMHGSKVVAHGVREVSKDGKTLTITHKGTDRQGAMVQNTAIYARQ
jgi:hypothetical protein